MRRFRPRFSIRTLVIVATLVCCYAACWGPTKRRGVDDVKKGPDERYRRWVQEYKAKNDQPWYILDKRHDVSVIAPLFLRLRTETVLRGPRDTYYFWFFGYVAKLPYERDLKSGWERLPVDFDFDIDSDVTLLSPQL